MKKPVVWSRDALDDVIDASVFVAQENPSSATRLADRLESAGNALSDFQTGRPGRQAGTFEKIVPRTRYIIVYRVTGNYVSIVRVIHTARHWGGGDAPG
ncbi:MAG: type II toxin-antitoxin system RelE/ParE family toxin [Pseudomonadota bacterium]